MAIPIHFNTVVIRRSALDEKYPGGFDGFRRSYGFGTFASDDHLASLSFMGVEGIEDLVGELERAGLALAHRNGNGNIAIVGTFSGGSAPWLSRRDGVCWLAGTEPGEIAEMAFQREERLAPGPVGRSLLALAIGDCLGAGVEGYPPEVVREVHSDTKGFVRDFRFDPMFWTDDTQQALTLVESVKRFGHPDPMWVAERWLRMNELRVHRGMGRGFRGSIEEFGRSRDPSTSGRTDRAGNGAAMRIAPTAIALGGSSDEEFVDRLVSVSLITHREIRALAGMLAVAWVARALSQPRYPPTRDDADRLLDSLIPWLRREEERLVDRPNVVSGRRRAHEVSDAFGNARLAWDQEWPQIQERVETFASKRRGEPTRIGEGFVTASVVGAVMWVLSSNWMLPETLVLAVGFGDDTDTMAAMVGGMAGAGTPRKSLPAKWQKFEGRDELVAWGRSIDKDEPLEGLPDVLDLETRLTQRRFG
jgi:ADP-ribosylglycohydrolase